MQESKLYALLTYAGGLPFAACALLPFAGVDAIPNIGSVDMIARVYGLAIASFVAGSHWGIYLFNQDRSPMNLFLASNVVVLAAFFAFLFTIAAIVLFVLVLALLYLLFVDFSLFRAGVTTRGYFDLRLRITLIVCACLALNVVHLA